MSVALKVSETFHASISDQAKFLLYEQKDLSELMQFYNALKQHETPMGEILIICKLLDAHIEVNASKYEWDHDLHLSPRSFDQRIARNQVSSGGLVHLWNLWKVQSLEILECLDSLERTDCVELEGTVAFCFTYFGLRLPDDSSVTFHLLNPDAAWVKSVEGFTRRNRNVVALEARHFASAAREFWLQELGFVGLRVLDALQQLHRSSMAKRLPVYSQSMCLLHIFDIAKFLADSKSIDLQYKEKRKLQDVLQLCTIYFALVFPLDPRESLSENMISLRETQLSKNLLEESVLRNISGRRELSSGQIGRVVMTLLGTGKLKHGFYDKISERLSNDSPWKPFIENLTKSEALSEALHKALQETYKIHWRAYDYISPHCLLYLVERLLILAPQPKGFFFTTKSSFLEYLISLPPDANPRNSLVTDIKSYPRGMVDFVLQVVEYYLCNRIEMVEWIKRSSINCNSYIPVMLLRLLMILCVVSINWDLSFDILNQKMSRTDITSHLPRLFREALRPRRRAYIAFVSAVATAFKGVGDPLVIVVLGGNRNFPYPDASFLDLRTLSRKADIMETLFPRSTEEASHDQPATFETRNVPEPSSIAQSEKGINRKLQINWDLIGEMSKGYESLIDKNNENLKSLLLSKKVEMEEHNNLIISAMEQCSHSDEYQDFPWEDARGLIQMLSQLSALITKSEYDTKAMRDFIEIFKILKATRPQLEALLRRVGQNTPNAVVASEEKNEDEDRKAEDSEAAASNPSPSNKGASCSRGKGKDKKRSSSNKGKGSKKK